MKNLILPKSIYNVFNKDEIKRLISVAHSIEIYKNNIKIKSDKLIKELNDKFWYGVISAINSDDNVSIQFSDDWLDIYLFSANKYYKNHKKRKFYNTL